MEVNIEFLSNTDEDFIKNSILVLLSTYAHLKKHSKKPLHHRNGIKLSKPSTQVYKLQKIPFETVNESKKSGVPYHKRFISKTPKGKVSSISIDQLILLKNVFEKIGENYSQTSLTRYETEREISISAIKQFWIDCFICDHRLMHLLMQTISDKKWVKCEDFIKCFENFQTDLMYNASPSKNQFDVNKKKKDLEIKKLLCNL